VRENGCRPGCQGTDGEGEPGAMIEDFGAEDGEAEEGAADQAEDGGDGVERPENPGLTDLAKVDAVTPTRARTAIVFVIPATTTQDVSETAATSGWIGWMTM
jgi:hypothetical protein